jgi:hypothetical protein
MKKLEKLQPINHSLENWDLLLLACGKIDYLIDLVNSQQEAIEKLESKVWTADFIEKYRPALESLAKADDKPEYKLPGTEEVIEKLDKATLRPNLVDGIPSDTHRTVTLRIPKGMGLGEALIQAYEWELEDSGLDKDKALDFRGWCFLALDSTLQKALDEVKE